MLSTALEDLSGHEHNDETILRLEADIREFLNETT